MSQKTGPLLSYVQSKLFFILAVSVFSTNLFGQSGKGSASAGSQNTDAKYEAALETYYNLVYNQEVDINWLLNHYRRNSGKLDKKYDYFRQPDFAKEASRRFKENWKSKARKVMSLQDLQYLAMFHKSALRRKIMDLETPMFRKEYLVPLFDSIQVGASAPAPAKPAPQPVKR